jgi:hypothetical protein
MEAIWRQHVGFETSVHQNAHYLFKTVGVVDHSPGSSLEFARVFFPQNDIPQKIYQTAVFSAIPPLYTAGHYRPFKILVKSQPKHFRPTPG